LIYFPSPIDVEPVMHMRRRLKFALRRWMMIPSFYEGVYNIESHSGSQIRWITSSPKVRLPGMRRDYLNLTWHPGMKIHRVSTQPG
jgi:hypothetical protein